MVFCLHCELSNCLSGNESLVNLQFQRLLSAAFMSPSGVAWWLTRASCTEYVLDLHSKLFFFAVTITRWSPSAVNLTSTDILCQEGCGCVIICYICQVNWEMYQTLKTSLCDALGACATWDYFLFSYLLKKLSVQLQQQNKSVQTIICMFADAFYKSSNACFLSSGVEMKYFL